MAVAVFASLSSSFPAVGLRDTQFTTFEDEEHN